MIELDVLHFHLTGARFVVCVNVCHQGVARAIYALTDDAAVFLLAHGVLVGDVTLERGFRT